MTRLEFCESFLFLKGRPISFAGRPYLTAIYNSPARRLVVRASRQVEKTTLLVNTILYAAVAHPGIHILFVCPRKEQAQVFSRSRLLPTIQQSPLLCRALLGRGRAKPQVMNLRLQNGSEVYLRAAYHSADAVRGIDGDLLFVDEFQDIAAGHLPVLEEALSHSRFRQVILTGTPKTIDNHLDGVFRQSSAREWQIPCPECSKHVILDATCLGPGGLVCPACQSDVDPRLGLWVARNPASTWGDGFWLNHLLTPWLNYPELLEAHRTYDPARFQNECLGLPTVLGDHLVTRAELEACCTDCPMAQELSGVPKRARARLVAGLDWGGGGRSRTVLVIGYMRDDFVFVVSRFERFAAPEEPDRILEAVARRCDQFGVRRLAADGGGNGHVYNRMLVERLQQRVVLHAILYSVTDQPPRQEGVLWRWTVNRSATLGTLFARVKARKILFPRIGECGTYRPVSSFLGQ